ncbi:hypothetical protein V499_09090 [Pseudogymnoascus sp. VKM F-103]|nr:hypothetical protein V499_09090 [Pseudogymnoascus sp. VKM F-103]
MSSQSTADTENKSPLSSSPSPPISLSDFFLSIPYFMASTEVDQKFLGQFAKNIASDNPLLSSMLFKLLGLSVVLAKQLVRARKLRKLDPTRATKSLDLYFHIIWLSREGLLIVEQYVLHMVSSFEELKVLTYKLRASFYHIFVLFHNQPSINSAGPRQITTPPGLLSPRQKQDKGKAPAIPGTSHTPTIPSPPESRSSSVQPSHPLEGGPVQHPDAQRDARQSGSAADFLLQSRDYIPTAMAAFQEANDLAERLLWGSHPLRLSVKTEFSAFLYDCAKDADRSRRLAKNTIAEVYNATEGMDDEMFEDAAELVGTLGKFMKRGLGSAGGSSSGSKSTLRAGASAAEQRAEPPRPLRSTPPRAENLRNEALRDARATPPRATPTRAVPPRGLLTPPGHPRRDAEVSPAVSGVGMDNPI